MLVPKLYKKVIESSKIELNKYLSNLVELKEKRTTYIIYREFYYEGLSEEGKKSLDRRMSTNKNIIELEESRVSEVEEKIKLFEKEIETYLSERN